MEDTFVKYIADAAHYNEVLTRMAAVRRSLWIGTADIKDVYVKSGADAAPLTAVWNALVRRGVEIRLLHAKEPGENFRADFDRFPALFSGMERSLCPRVHFKLLVFDGDVAYIGSANLTGAGIGMKGSARRNFEAGILTNDRVLVDAAMAQFDSVWSGVQCQKCGRKDFCGDPIYKNFD